MTTKKRRGRGGRTPGVWRPSLSPEKLRAFREEFKVSRASLAALVKVSSTTIQNWETAAATPTSRRQDDLERVMASVKSAGKLASPVRTRLIGGASGDGGELVATGQIVAAYLASGRTAGSTMSPEDLCSLVRSVKAALT